jgi:cytochrome c biogenesis protein CcdA
MENTTFGFLSLVFSAGLLSFFSPCILPLLPVYMSTLTLSGDFGTFRSIHSNLARALFFSAGLSLPLFLFGLGAGAVGHFFDSPLFFLVCGIFVAIFGLAQTGLIHLPLGHKCPYFGRTGVKGVLPGAFALGFLFSFGWTSCTGPLLAALLSLAAQWGDPLGGGFLLLVYSFGLSLPFVLLALGFQQFLKRFQRISDFFPLLQKIGGVLLIVMGGWMIFTQLQHIL